MSEREPTRRPFPKEPTTDRNMVGIKWDVCFTQQEQAQLRHVRQQLQEEIFKEQQVEGGF